MEKSINMEKSILPPQEELLTAYKVIGEIMENFGFTKDTSFRRVQSFLSESICNQMLSKEK